MPKKKKSAKRKTKEDVMIERENRILEEEKRLGQKEDILIKEEQKVEEMEDREFAELKKLEKIEEDIKKNTTVNPLRKITYMDFTKGFVGSMFVSVGHFAFYYSDKIATDLSLANAHMLFIFSVLILVGFMYFTGFRRKPEKKYLKFSFIRIVILFIVSIISATLVLFFFGKVRFPVEFVAVYIKVAIMCPAAVIGAGTADLIGKRGEE